MHRVIFILLFLLTSCNLPAYQKPGSSSAVVQESAVPVTETPGTILPSTLIPKREKYTLNTTIDYDQHTVIVDETILYPNHTGQNLDKLVLAVAPDLWLNCFSLTGLSIDNIPISDYTLDAHRLDLPLPASHLLGPDSVATIILSYKLTLPFLDQAHSLRARIGDEAFLAFLRDYAAQGKDRIVNANDFFRILDEHTDVNYSDIVHRYFKNR